MNKNDDVVGLVPAAGYARRVHPLLPCSKEIYPITHSRCESQVASSYLMENFKRAGVQKAYLIVRTGKWDILEYYQDGSEIGLNLAHVLVGATGGVPQTIDKAYAFIKDKIVLLGFPDILFKPFNAFTLLLEKQQTTNADLVLGLFSITNPGKADMVSFNGNGKLKDIVIKPDQTNLLYTWIIAAWTSTFSDFLHQYVEAYNREHSDNGIELHIGDVVREAIQTGMKTAYVKFENGSYLDIGTPNDLQKVNNADWVQAFELND